MNRKSDLVIAISMSIASCLASAGCEQGHSGSSGGLALTGLRSWATTYGGKATDRPHDVQQTADGGYIVVGETESFGAGEKDFWVMKQDVDGNVVWSRAYGDGNILLNGISGLGFAWSANGVLDSNQIAVVAAEDGGWMAAGGLFEGISDDGVNNNGPIFQVTVVKVDPSGRIRWRKVYPGGERGGRAMAIERVQAGGYVVAGYVEARGFMLDNRNRDLLVLRLAEDGRELWRKVMGEGTHEVATCIQEAPDGGFVVGVIKHVEPEDDPPRDFVTVLKLDASGQETVWLRNHFGGDALRAYSIALDANRETYTVAGVVQDEVNDSYESRDNSFNIWALNIRDSDGEEEWTESFEANGDFTNAGDQFFSVDRRQGAGFVLAGYSGILSRDGLLVQLESDGDVDRAVLLGGEHRDELHAVHRTAGGSYIAAGFKGIDSDPNFPRQDVWVVEVFEDLSVKWERTYEFAPGSFGQSSRAYSIEEAADESGFLVAGAGAVGGWLLRIDRQGNEEWRKTVRDRTNEVAYSVQQTDDDRDGDRDDGYIVVGTAESFGRTTADAWVLKLDEDGELEWQETVGGEGEDEAFGVQVATDGGYLVAGSTCTVSQECGDFGDLDAWVFKLHSQGALEWQRVHSDSDNGSFNNDVARALIETGDGGLLVVGEGFGSQSCSGGFALKLRADGELDWPAPVRFCGRIPRSALATSDGEYILAGTLFRSDEVRVRDDFWVARLGPGGEVLQEVSYGGEDEFDSEDQAFSLAFSEDGYLVAGHTRSFGGGQACESDFGERTCANIWLLSLNPDLSIAWEKTYSTALEDKAWAVRQTRDGGFIVAGETDTSFLATEEVRRGIDAWMLKVEDDGSACEVTANSSAQVRDVTQEGRAADLAARSTGALGASRTEIQAFDANPTVDTICFRLLRTFELDLDIRGQGRVTSAPPAVDCTSSCAVQITEGTRLTLTATADAGWEFSGWPEDCPGGAVEMDSDRRCEVTFRRVEGGGGIDITGYWRDDFACGQTCGNGPAETLEDTTTLVIERNGGEYMLTDLDTNFEASGTLNGNVFTWSGSSPTPDGRTVTESGTYTFAAGGGSFTKTSTYTTSAGPGGNPPACSGTCTGNGSRF